MSLPSRNNKSIPIYVFVPPSPVYVGNGCDPEAEQEKTGEWRVPVVLDFHGGAFVMGGCLEQSPYASMMSRELGAVVISVWYRMLLTNFRSGIPNRFVDGAF